MPRSIRVFVECKRRECIQMELLYSIILFSSNTTNQICVWKMTCRAAYEWISNTPTVWRFALNHVHQACSKYIREDVSDPFLFDRYPLQLVLYRRFQSITDKKKRRTIKATVGATSQVAKEFEKSILADLPFKNRFYLGFFPEGNQETHVVYKIKFNLTHMSKTPLRRDAQRETKLHSFISTDSNSLILVYDQSDRRQFEQVRGYAMEFRNRPELIPVRSTMTGHFPIIICGFKIQEDVDKKITSSELNRLGRQLGPASSCFEYNREGQDDRSRFALELTRQRIRFNSFARLDKYWIYGLLYCATWPCFCGYACCTSVQDCLFKDF